MSLSASGVPASSSTGGGPAPATTSNPAPAPSTSSAAPTSPTSPSSQTSSSAASASPTAGVTSASTPTSATSKASTTLAQQTSTVVVPTTITPTPTQFETTSGGVVVTIFTSVAPSITSSTSPHSSSTSFWSNTGAVAGVFSVVGVIGLALAILLITTAVRRRRAIQFDKEIAAAAAEAAASSRSPFDDFPEPSPGGYGYSDNSHGTFAQPPMRPAESYSMSELSQYGPYAAGGAMAGGGAAFDAARNRKGSEVGAPGIAGVGAGNLAREPSRRAPYHAFAGPGPQDLHDPSANTRYPRSTLTQDPVLEATGLAGTGAVAMAGNTGNAQVNRRPSEYTYNTHRSGRSQGYGSSSDGGHPTQLQPGYQSDGFPPQRSNSRTIAGMADPYGGYVPEPYPKPVSPPLPNPQSSSPSPPANDYGHTSFENEDRYHESGSPIPPPAENRMSFQDEDDYSQGPRVLRVTNA